MIMVGRSITSADDLLQKTTLDYLVNAIRRPRPEITMLIRTLRGVYTLNPKQYSVQKRKLPYFVCGSFNPPYRRKENFSFTEVFMLDVDKLQAKGLSMTSVRSEVQSDSRVLACFKSPSEDGLKIMFRLKERIYDPGQFSVFYKEFSRAFANNHNILQVIDTVTSDVSRACFISIDPDIYFNPNAEAIDFHCFLPDEFGIIKNTRKKEKADDDTPHNIGSNKEDEKCIDPDDDIIAKIKAKLSLKTQKYKPEPFVPAVLNDIIEGVSRHIKSFGINVDEISNIQYGKKIKCTIGVKRGEINIFYGKRGFSIIKSPKAGTNDEFNTLLCDMIKAYISTV